MCDTCANEEDIFRPLARIDELPDCCGVTMHRKICAPMVIADIQPYQSMGIDVATGKAPVITSRSEHRAYLRRNGYVEVGNEMPKATSRPIQGDFNVRADLAQAVKQVIPKYTV
jgi:hypothetical protein